MVSRVFQLQDGYRGRVGFYGGTFDPIHNAHLYAAAQAMALTCLRIAENPDVLTKAWDELKKKNGGGSTEDFPPFGRFLSELCGERGAGNPVSEKKQSGTGDGDGYCQNDIPY